MNQHNFEAEKEELFAVAKILKLSQCYLKFTIKIAGLDGDCRWHIVDQKKTSNGTTYIKSACRLVKKLKSIYSERWHVALPNGTIKTSIISSAKMV